MDGKGNNRGAYAQVTAPIGDDPKVTIQQGGKSDGMCSCTRKKLGIAIAAAIAVIIIIIIIIVFSTKNTKHSKIVQGNSTATVGKFSDEKLFASCISDVFRCDLHLMI